MDCPRCKSSSKIKAGIVKGRQRYKCKQCSYHYTVKRKSDVKPKAVRRLALEMYLEGVGLGSIGRILKISHVRVYYWIKSCVENANLPVRQAPIEIVELDEMHTYVRSKKTTVGYGLLLIDWVEDLSILSVGADQLKPD